jgi:hypothetical protein
MAAECNRNGSGWGRSPIPTPARYLDSNAVQVGDWKASVIWAAQTAEVPVVGMQKPPTQSESFVHGVLSAN